MEEEYEKEDLKFAIALIFDPLIQHADFLNDLSKTDYYNDGGNIANGNLESNMHVLSNISRRPRA